MSLTRGCPLTVILLSAGFSKVFTFQLRFSYSMQVRLHNSYIVLVSELNHFQLTKRLLVLVNSIKSVLFGPNQLNFSYSGIEYMIP